MLMKLVVLALAVSSASAAHPISDCGSSKSIAHFKNLAISFKESNGASSTSVHFPGKIIISSGEVDFTSTHHTLTGCTLNLNMDISIVHLCKTLETFGIKLCELDLCKTLQGVEKEDICTAISTGTKFEITKFPVTSFSLPSLSWELKLIVNNKNVKVGATVTCPKTGSTPVACLDFGTLNVKAPLF